MGQYTDEIHSGRAPEQRSAEAHQTELFGHYPSPTHNRRATPAWKHDLGAPSRTFPEELFPIIERMEAVEFRVFFRPYRGWSVAKVVDLPVISSMILHTFKAKPTAIKWAHDFRDDCSSKAPVRVIEPLGSQKLRPLKKDKFNKYGYCVVAKGKLRK